MQVRLSQNKITSFAGDVLPLRLLGVAEYAMEPITWAVSDPCVQLTTFYQAQRDPFTDGVLLTLLTEGEACVTAQYQGQVFSCCVTVRKRAHTPSGKELGWYVGNFHDHTAQTHKREEFPLRKEGLPRDYLKQLTEEGMLDCTVISDHADLLNDREFFRGFWDASVAHEGLVVFPGSEAEVSPLWDDRYGVEHKLGGEIVVFNCDSYASTGKWSQFFDRYQNSPFAIGVLAHPQIVGTSRKGVWNFALDRNRTPELLRLLRGVEMGDGSDRDSNLINEHTYSVALDNGFRVSTTCSSDRHGPVWGGKLFSGRTILMAPEKSKEAFYDALDSCRFYASESGNVKVFYQVNGQAAPSVLPMCEEYRFDVELGLLNQEAGGMPVRLQVISDYGKTLLETESVAQKMTFTVKSTTARWFYLRLTDEKGQRTWSVPIWTGRKPDAPRQETLTPIAKNGFTATEESTGQDVSVLLNDDPYQPYFHEASACSILLDMGKAETVAALGVYHTMLDVKAMRAIGEKQSRRIAEFPVRYCLETGMTPQTMTPRAEGVFRVFGEEEMICMPAHSARFVRLRILSNAGSESGRPDYRQGRTSLAELTVFQKSDV